MILGFTITYSINAMRSWVVNCAKQCSVISARIPDAWAEWWPGAEDRHLTASSRGGGLEPWGLRTAGVKRPGHWNRVRLTYQNAVANVPRVACAMDRRHCLFIHCILEITRPVSVDSSQKPSVFVCDNISILSSLYYMHYSWYCTLCSLLYYWTK